MDKTRAPLLYRVKYQTTLIVGFLASATLAFFPIQTLAADSVPGKESTKGTVAPQEQFEYFIEDRKDPFVPFITAKAATSDINMDEIVDTEERLTGMQLFEPGQLNLVALMQVGTTHYAMVEDFTGKGYTLASGMKIGRRGVIKEIVPNQVIIEETAHTRAGKKIVTKTVMVLKKEGEE